MEANEFWKRAKALRIARDKANNMEFKILWNNKLKELLLNRPVQAPVCTTPQRVRAWVVSVLLMKSESG